MRLDGKLVVRTLVRARRTMSIDDIARAMGVSRGTIYNWIEKRSEPYVKEKMRFVRLCEELKDRDLLKEWA